MSPQGATTAIFVPSPNANGSHATDGGLEGSQLPLFVKHCGVSRLTIVPSLFAALVRSGQGWLASHFQTLRVLVLSGELLSTSLFTKALQIVQVRWLLFAATPTYFEVVCVPVGRG